MVKEEIIERLNMVFQDIFDDIAITINELANVEDLEEWDSLKHISLLLAIEKCFHFKFKANEVAETKNIDFLVAVIVSHVNKSAE